jgi:hypothetical protein
VDISIIRLKECQALKVYDDLILADISHPPFKPETFDVIVFSEVIEHLEKADAYRALNELDALAIKQIIITTPKGCTKGPETDSYQTHKSGWEAAEFRAAGYSVWGRCMPSMLFFLPPFNLINYIHLKTTCASCLVAVKIKKRRVKLGLF